MKVGVLVSGNGTNLQALLDAEARGELDPAKIALVISNKPDVPALGRAEAASVPTKVVEHRGLERVAFENELLAVLDSHRIEAIVLAGFMRVLTSHFCDRYPRRILNTHPSLLPAFAGKDAIGQALAYGVKLTGATIHFVDSTLDGGPIIAQESVAVFDRDSDDRRSLVERIQAVEHRLLPKVVRSLAAGQLACDGRIVTGTRAE